MTIAIKVENLSKHYRLGLTHSGSVRELVNAAASRLFGRHDEKSAPLPENSRLDDDGKFWALKNVNLEIKTGEVVGIIGRNGAGKSTLLKILSRITLPTAGRIEMRGRVACLLEVGTGFHPELTGRENVYMNGAILGMTNQEIDRQFDDIVEFAGVQTFIDTPVKRYSSGMTVRLGFAVAAHLEPEILIVDEVLAVGDAQFQERCMGKLDNVANSGRTVLFVSHNMQAVKRLTSRCIVMDEGQVAYVGETEDACDRYMQNAAATSAGSSIATMSRADWAGDQSVRFTYAENLTKRVEQGRDIHIRLGMESIVDAQSSFGLTLHGSNGDPIASAFGPPIDFGVHGRRVTVEIVISNPGLAPDHYWFSMGLVRGTREVVDVVHDVLHFEVPAGSNIPQGFTEWNSAWGRLKLNLECRDVSVQGNVGKPLHCV